MCVWGVLCIAEVDAGTAGVEGPVEAGVDGALCSTP